MFSRRFFVVSAIITAWIAFLDSIVESSADSCGKYRTSMDDNRFLGHRFTKTFETSAISIPLQCYIKCMNDCSCLSFNVCDNNRQCELNSERKDSDLSQFKQTDACDYYEFGYNQESPSGGCLDRCTCSSSQSESCLNGGTCQGSCMKNGKRSKCACPDGFKGDHCEVLPRSCAAYTPSTKGLRLIYAPDNTSYEAYCHFQQGVGTYTLAMSYTRGRRAAYHDNPLTADYPVSEDSQEWNNYRLSLARMQGLRDASTHWVLACSYPTRGLPLADYIRVKISETDLITYTTASLGNCRKVSFIEMKSKSCSDCIVGMSQGGVMFHLSYTYRSSCSGAWTGVPNNACSSGTKVRYFGSYICYDLGFTCSSTNSATTQLWALTLY